MISKAEHDEAILAEVRRRLRAGETVRGARVPVVVEDDVSYIAQVCVAECRRAGSDLVELRGTREERAEGLRVFTWKALAWRLGLETGQAPGPRPTPSTTEEPRDRP